MQYWRVVNWNEDAATPAENGHPLYVWPDQGGGRVDDPDREYAVLYVGSTPEGAIAEAFGQFSRWTPEVLEAPPGSPPGTVKALVEYEGDPGVLDLDDPYALVDWSLRPSHVVLKGRSITQAWARAIHDSGQHDGVAWWSYYAPQWSSIGLWDWSTLRVVGIPAVLHLEDAVIERSAGMVKRIIVTS